MEDEDNKIVRLRTPVVEPEVVQTVEDTSHVAIRTEENLKKGGDGGVEVPMKRRGGRPKKPPPDMKYEFVSQEFCAPCKRGRGRPKGTDKWQKIAASLGEAVETVGSDITPHVVSIQTGQNISQHIWSFFQGTSASTFILSASGSVSNAELHHPTSFGGIVRYEIVTLKGSYIYNEVGGVCRRVSHLNVQLASPERHLFGGPVAGLLIASGPTQLVIGSFMQNIGETIKHGHLVEPPRPNNNIAATIHVENDKINSDAEQNRIRTAIPLKATMAGAVGNVINDPEENHTCFRSIGWNPELASEHVT